jgi:hypothetical protein
LQRLKRAEELFDRQRPFDYKQFIRYYFLHDTVALVALDENKNHEIAHWSKLYKVPDDLLTGGSFSVRLNKADRKWALDLCAQKGIHIGQLA